MEFLTAAEATRLSAEQVREQLAMKYVPVIDDAIRAAIKGGKKHISIWDVDWKTVSLEKPSAEVQEAIEVWYRGQHFSWEERGNEDQGDPRSCHWTRLGWK